MAAYSVQQKYLIDNYAVLVLLTNADPLEVGQSFTVTNVDATFNGTYTVFALPQYYFTGVNTEGFFSYNIEAPILNQVLYAKTADNVDIVPATGTLTTTPVCTWITAGQIEDWLGIGTATAADTAFLTQCALASNSFAYRRRAEAGYRNESLTTVPNGSVSLGAIMYGGALYRQRGGVTDFATFDGLGSGGTVGLSPMVKQLLGVDRPAVA
jgi:hypothetical protein